MAVFEIAYKITGGHEGGYVNDPHDYGGETYKGISRRAHPYWPGWKIIDELKRATGFPAILYEHTTLNKKVVEFYKIEYWDYCRLDDLNNQEVANELYDSSVNLGKYTVAHYFQRAINVANDRGRYYPDIERDGIIGKETLNAFHQHPRPETILKILNVLQGYKYISIAEYNPVQEKYINGWFKRVFEISLNGDA